MKVFLLSRDTIMVYSVVFLLILGVFAFGGDFFSSVITTATPKEIPIYSVETSDKKVAFSFDAAWGNEDTKQLIEIFKKYNVRTSFFVVGGWVDRFPDDVKALSQAGHEILNHSDGHLRMNSLSIEQIKSEIKNCDDKIQNVTGKVVKLFRPPYGEYNNNVVSSAKELGHMTIQWNVDSLDWKELTSEQIIDRVVSRVKSGSICLFHNGTKNTATALPTLIENLQKQGYKIVPVSELIYKEGYTIDNNGMQKLKIANSVVD